MGETMRTRDKLATELRKVAGTASEWNAKQYEAFAKRAETGEFDDYADTYVCPITQLCDWQYGGATIFGETYVGFKTEEQLARFESEFPDRLVDPRLSPKESA